MRLLFALLVLALSSFSAAQYGQGQPFILGPGGSRPSAPALPPGIEPSALRSRPWETSDFKSDAATVVEDQRREQAGLQGMLQLAQNTNDNAAPVVNVDPPQPHAQTPPTNMEPIPQEDYSVHLDAVNAIDEQPDVPFGGNQPLPMDQHPHLESRLLRKHSAVLESQPQAQPIVNTQVIQQPQLQPQPQIQQLPMQTAPGFPQQMAVPAPRLYQNPSLAPQYLTSTASSFTPYLSTTGSPMDQSMFNWMQTNAQMRLVAPRMFAQPSGSLYPAVPNAYANLPPAYPQPPMAHSGFPLVHPFGSAPQPLTENFGALPQYPPRLPASGALEFEQRSGVF